MTRGERAGVIGTLALVAELVACSSGAKAPAVSASTPEGPLATTSSGRVAGMSPTTRPTERRLYAVPSAPGETKNPADCPAIAPISGAANPGPQAVELTATPDAQGFTEVKGTDFTAVSQGGSDKVVVTGNTVQVDQGTSAKEYQTNGDDVIVDQQVSGDNLIAEGNGARHTACLSGPDQLKTFEDSLGYHGPVIIFTMRQNSVSVTRATI